MLIIADWLRNDLTANPIQELTFRTGKPALIILILALSVTPVRRIFNLKAVVPLRRILGLYSFFYASMHFSVFVVLDYFFDWFLIKQAIGEKPFVLVGFSAYVILTLLAITSTKGWKRLHYSVYAAGTLVVLHFVWLVKSDIREPLAYGAVVAVLLLVRIPFVRRRVALAKR